MTPSIKCSHRRGVRDETHLVRMNDTSARGPGAFVPTPYSSITNLKSSITRSGITPGLTRCAAALLYMTMIVSAVGCMRLSGDLVALDATTY